MFEPTTEKRKGNKISKKASSKISKTAIEIVIRKKSRPYKGLKPTSVAKILRAGSGIDGARISTPAVKATQDLVEGYLKELGQCASKFLTLSDKKTVNTATLEYCLETVSSLKNLKGLNCAARTTMGQKFKKDENKLAILSVLRCFAKGINLGKGNGLFQISDDAKMGLTRVAILLVSQVGKDAGLFAINSKRKTILFNDVSSVISIRQ
jgi:histone H3/H4